MNVLGQPNFSMIFQRPSPLTVSKALVRSTKVVKMSHCCSMHFSSTSTEAALALRKEALLQVLQQTVEQDTC